MGTGVEVRRAAFEQIGGMDESYFLYMEDVDLCARLWLAGWRVLAAPGARLVRDHQRSSAKSPFARTGRAHLKSLKRFSEKFRIPLLKAPAENVFFAIDLK